LDKFRFENIINACFILKKKEIWGRERVSERGKDTTS
jgi:hypothetical protein